MFANGAFSRDAKGDPLRVDAERLAALTPMDIAMGFQVKAHNPLAGLEGRAGLLRKLGSVGLDRPGALFDVIAKDAATVKAPRSSPRCSTSSRRSGRSPMGDVWPHPVRPRAVSQALAMAVLLAGRADRERRPEVVELDALTGLPEYRNGGLLVDAGALRPKQSRLLSDSFKPGDEAIVEWRALTVALLDQVGAHVRVHLGMDADALPLVKCSKPAPGSPAACWRPSGGRAADRRLPSRVTAPYFDRLPSRA